MGLRFRKSIKLCKGVRMNIGKTGVSISAGVPGFRKTIHSSGRVTTSVGVPGTGVYYVDTKNPAKKKTTTPMKTQSEASAYTGNHVPQPTVQRDPNFVEYPTYILPVDLQSKTAVRQYANDGYEARKINNSTIVIDSEAQLGPSVIKPVDEEIHPIPDVKLPDTMVTELFEHCDYPVKWIDVITNAQPPDSVYNSETWEYLRSKAIDVFEGDVEAILEIIERINPYDDLLDYLTDFVFEADDAECVKVTCRMIQNSFGSEKEDAAASLLIRLARDTFALLPVRLVRIRMLNAPPLIIDDVYFERDVFADKIFENKDPSELLTSLCRS